MSEKLYRNASLLLNSIFFLFFIACILLFSLVIVNQVKNAREIKIKIEEVKFNKKDSTFYKLDYAFLDSLNEFSKKINIKFEDIENLKEKMKEQESKNGDFFKIFLALIGGIFAVVGFFGFKSINDTKEAAIKNAEVEAKSVAETEATKVATEQAGIVAKAEATRVAAIETKSYLDDNIHTFYKNVERDVVEKNNIEFIEIRDRIDQLERPDAFPEKKNKLIKELEDSLSKLKQEFEDYKNSELRREIDELKKK